MVMTLLMIVWLSNVKLYGVGGLLTHSTLMLITVATMVKSIVYLTTSRYSLVDLIKSVWYSNKQWFKRVPCSGMRTRPVRYMSNNPMFILVFMCLVGLSYKMSAYVSDFADGKYPDSLLYVTGEVLVLITIYIQICQRHLKSHL